MKSTNLRLPDKLHESLKKTSSANRRSLNSEILRAIEYYLKNAPEAHYETASQPADQVVEVKKLKTK